MDEFNWKEKPDERQESSGRVASTGASRAVILCVEDDSATRDLLRLTLSRDYDIVCTADGDGMWRLLREHGDDVRLILMDLSLHGSDDGITLTRALRSDPKWQSLPVIATTAHALNHDRLTALEAGCNEYLAKPIRLHTLRAAIERLLQSPVAPKKTGRRSSRSESPS